VGGGEGRGGEEGEGDRGGGRKGGREGASGEPRHPRRRPRRRSLGVLTLGLLGEGPTAGVRPVLFSKSTLNTDKTEIKGGRK
jgi:hypothetical protein